MRLRYAVLVAASSALACGGSPPKTRAKPAPLTAPTATSSAELPPDLSPVARPRNVIAVGRSGQIAHWRKQRAWTDLFGGLDAQLDAQLASKAPVEISVAVEERPAGPVPQASVVISAGLESLRGALSALDNAGVSLQRIGRGVHLIDDSRARCAVAAAVGTAPARLVCASSRAALDQLLPYAVRGLPNEPSASEDDAWLVVDVARFRELHGERLRRLESWALPFVGSALAQLDPRLDRALTPLLGSIYGELMAILGDVDTLRVSAKLAESGVTLRTRIELGRAARSSLAATLLEAGTRQAPPPADFSKLPADAELAFFSHGMAPKHAELFRNTLRGALSRGVRTSVPKQTIGLVIDALFPEPPFVYAGGRLDVAMPLEYTLATRIRTNSERVLGWHVLGVETDPTALGKRLDAGMNDYNRGPLRALVYGEAERLCEGLPKITRRAAPRKGLPAGSVLYEMIVPGKLFDDCAAKSGYARFTRRKAVPTPPLSIAVVFAPGKPRSWIVVSPNTEMALERMRAVLAGGGTSAVKPGGLDEKSVFGVIASDELLGARPGASNAQGTLTVATDQARAIEIRMTLPESALER